MFAPISRIRFSTWLSSRLIPFYLSNKTKVFNNQYYDPRLQSIPNLSLRIEPRFSGVGQIGSGSANILNNDGEFDGLNRVLDWDYGRAVFKMGIDSNAGTMAYTDYVTLGTWGIERAEIKDQSLVLSLRELKTQLEKEIPTETYSLDDYPLLERTNVGKPIPIAYGKVFGAKPTLIDPGNKTFKLTSHAIYDILEVRIQQDDVWVQINPASRDLPNGEFTLGSEWANNEPVSVDFIGKTLADGRPMYNASDIVEDILTYLNEENLDSATFDSAFEALDVGLQNDGIRRTVFKPSIYLDALRKAHEVVSDINTVAGSFLFVNREGEWNYEVSTPKSLPDVDFHFYRDRYSHRFVFR
jgi:hypothetical protein